MHTYHQAIHRMHTKLEKYIKRHHTSNNHGSENYNNDKIILLIRLSNIFLKIDMIYC